MWGWHPFGGDVTEHRTFGGLTVPAAGRIGWFPGSVEWAKASSSATGSPIWSS